MPVPNKYLVGAFALGAVRRVKSEMIGFSGWDWTTVFYDPAGGAYRYLNQGPTPNFSPGAAANPYWTKQRQATNPLSQGVTQRTQAAQQFQQQLRAQQQAFMQQLQQQAAAQPSPYAPPPSTSSDSGFPSPPDGSADGGAPDDSSVVGAAGDQYVVIKVKNVGDLVKKQGGALGNAAFGLLPQMITNTVYTKMRDEFSKKLGEQGVDAEVSVTASPPGGAVPAGEGIKFGLIAVGTVGAGWGLWHFLLRPLLRRK